MNLMSSFSMGIKHSLRDLKRKWRQKYDIVNIDNLEVHYKGEQKTEAVAKRRRRRDRKRERALVKDSYRKKNKDTEMYK